MLPFTDTEFLQSIYSNRVKLFFGFLLIYSFIPSFLHSFIYLWLHWVFVAVPGLFSCCGEGGLLFVAVHGLLIAVASLVAEHGLQARKLQQLWHAGSRAQAQQLWHTGLVAPWHVESSQTRAQTCVSCIGRRILFFFFFFLFVYFTYIYFWLRWVFVAVHGLSLVAVSGSCSSLWCAGFSLQWLLLLQSTGSWHMGFSSCGSRALEHRLSSYGAQAQLLRSMWDLPRPGLEPVSPALAGRLNHCAPREALAGGFLTTALPGKSQSEIVELKIMLIFKLTVNYHLFLTDCISLYSYSLYESFLSSVFLWLVVSLCYRS